jgi:hypothetical protein
MAIYVFHTHPVTPIIGYLREAGVVRATMEFYAGPYAAMEAVSAGTPVAEAVNSNLLCPPGSPCAKLVASRVTPDGGPKFWRTGPEEISAIVEIEAAPGRHREHLEVLTSAETQGVATVIAPRPGALVELVDADLERLGDRIAELTDNELVASVTVSLSLGSQVTHSSLFTDFANPRARGKVRAAAAAKGGRRSRSSG